MIGISTSPLQLLLVILAVVAYATVVHNDFVGFDDDYYITENPVVQQGLTWGGVTWAFTSFHCANWHPLTWMSHMTDVTLFGMHPAGHHLVNLAFHILSVLLLFYFLGNTTGAIFKSFLVAALFAVHPLHVESVAWAAERKDVLSHFFFALMLVVYARYARKPAWTSYVAVAALLALGLLAKPMLVTAPLLLFLVDYWPLQRFSLNKNGDAPLFSPAPKFSEIQIDKLSIWKFD
jgi:4-amino-4-deoxy-L-arabinose transferase-like glycosyltransferase